MSKLPDEYAEKYMGGSQALAHTRVRMAWWFFALMGAMALFVLGSGVSIAFRSGILSALVPLGISLPLLLAVTLLLSHLRLTVTGNLVVVQYGLFGPRIPLDRITSATAETYNWKEFGGWGIKWSIDGTMAYSVPGASRCVRVVYTDAKGRTRKVVVSTDDPEAIVQAVQQGRSAGRTRVAAEASPAAAEAIEVEAGAAKGADEAGR